MGMLKPTRLLGVVLCTGILVSCGDEASDDPIVGEASISVLHYDYHFSMETREAVASLRIRIDRAGNCFSLPMRSEGIRAVHIDGEPAVSTEHISAEHDGSEVRLCGIGWPAESEIEFTSTTTVPLATWNDSQVGYSVSTDIEGGAFSYMVSWVGGCDRFAPCDSKASAFATYRFTIDHPAGQTVGDVPSLVNFR